ncbi:hypothetical protein AWM79_12305 [Pseudomonas agarici]|uniref:DUF3275 domain-containing protein n=1 Tax=Pseudomonas agarici TaxID=46677 RepID=A0A0X1T2F8_PSEAA|nr:DUF3275 family protein [Pseudomonas agarici]AMB86039.1 hypothetical protein AWM79_12305 [Pseudomonas agarici]
MINIPGQLAIRTITGRNGDFNVGRLSTSIGEFVIKDALLEQYNEGKYRGDFAIRGIRPSHYSTGGRLVVEIRAELESMSLDDVDKLTVEDTARLTTNESDPLDEEAPRTSPTQQPRKRRPVAQATSIQPSADDAPFGMESSSTTSNDDDAELFGTLWPLGKTVRLDTTVDRQRLRAQCTRLGELGYIHDFKQQSWNCQSYT